ncbi:MAG: DedA family protein [Lachnospiraceae bacterium]|nr:DedA family protein [Lachnospiraceae bacterium]
MSFVENIINQYGLAAIFLLILLEYACFPLSSEIILPLAGLMGARLSLPFVTLVLVSTAAGLGGTSLTYGIGRFGGSPLLEKAMHRFPSLEKPILASYRTFGNHGGGAVFLSRLIPLCRTYIGFVAGAMKQSLGSYLFCSAFGILLWNTVLTGLGYYFYQYREVFFLSFNKYKKWILLFGSLLLLLILFCKLSKSRRTDESDQE